MTTAIATTSSRVEHLIPNCLLEKRVRVTVVGCGGTGSAIAAGLPYLHQAMIAQGHPHGLDVTFIDGDKISRANCVRQPFSVSEIGLYKATVLATRINLFWGLGWKGAPRFLDESWRGETDILIGCVDSRKARNAIIASQAHWNSQYWLDIGNNADTGQFVLGQPDNRNVRNISQRLPTVADLFPEIVNPKLDKKDRLPSTKYVYGYVLAPPVAFSNTTLPNQIPVESSTSYYDWGNTTT